MSSLRYRIEDANKQIIYCNLRDQEKELIGHALPSCPLIQDRKIRAGTAISNLGKVIGFTNDPDFLRSSQKLKTTLNAILDSVKYIFNATKTHNESTNNSTKRLIHNLTSLNAHIIQEVYSIVPQELLASKSRGHLEFVRTMVSESPDDVAHALLAIAKASASMKTEFSVFKNLFNPEPALHNKHHVVHKVLMNVLYLFFPDFTDKNVFVSVAESTLTAWFDYESIHVALYHLIDNASKYVKVGSDIEIAINEEDSQAVISMTMTSLKISPDEVSRLFEEGYSGNLAIKTGKAGGGIGVFLVKKVLELNNGSIELKIYPNTAESVLGIDYQMHTFEIKLPRRPTPAIQ